MQYFTKQQQSRALGWLILFHIFIIASSNFLVQFPIKFLGFEATLGMFTFPFIFLATDLTVRIFGARSARRIIFYTMFPALLLSYLVSVLFVDGHWQGMTALQGFNTFVGRIALASFSAYVIGQLMDIIVFDRLRRNYVWWVAPAVSAIFGNLVDTIAFFTIAFYRSADPFMAANFIEIGAVDYALKLTISLLLFVPLYGLLLKQIIARITASESINLSGG